MSMTTRLPRLLSLGLVLGLAGVVACGPPQGGRYQRKQAQDSL
jgi:hypothetical protein